MGTFKWVAFDGSGSRQKGEVEAESEAAVASQLRASGLTPIDVSGKYKSQEISIDFLNRVSANDLAIGSRQLATMVTSGMTIMRALDVMEAQTQNKKLKETWLAVRKEVESGSMFSDALAKFPKIFGPLYVSMVRAGELGGVLEECLLRVADQLEKDAALKRQVRAAMIYPSVVISFAVIVLLALVTFLIPVFVNVFKQFPGQLPPLTKMMVGLSNLVTHQGYILLAVAVVSVVAFRFFKRSEYGAPKWDAFKLRVPMKIGDIVQKVAIARWSRTFASLSSAGVPIMQAIDITGKTAGNLVVENVMTDVIASVKSGGTIAAPLKDAKVFPAMVTHMVGVGEETGALDAMLSKIADFYDDEVATAVKALTSILEPVMIVVVGGIVGIIVVSMYMPLFSMYNNIR